MPKPLVGDLWAAGLLGVRSGKRIATHPGETVIQLVRKAGLIILRTARDSWDYRQHPMQKSPSIISLGVPPDQIDAATEALALL